MATSKIANASSQSNGRCATPHDGLASDPHPLWLAEIQALDAATPEGDLLDDIADQCLALHRQILTTPARTVAGALVQLERLTCDQLADVEPILESVAAVLRQLQQPEAFA